MVLEFVVEGRPVPTGRARSTPSGRHYTPTRTEQYQRSVTLHALKAMAAQKWPAGGLAPDAFYSVRIDVYRAMNAGDADNFAKGIKDGMTRAGVWVDDRQVTSLRVEMYVDKVRPRAHVRVERVEE